MITEFPHDGTCPVCKAPKATVTEDSKDAGAVKCEFCLRFTITKDAYEIVDRWPLAERARLSGALNEMFETGQRDIVVTSESLAGFLSSAPTTFDIPAKVRKLLLAIARRSDYPGKQLKWRTVDAVPAGYATDRAEGKYLLHYAKTQGWVHCEFGHEPYAVFLTPQGWEEAKSRPRIDSTQGFVAMSFAEVMRATYAEAIEPAIRDGCGFECRRIDAKEYNGAVIDEIKAEIRQSRFVVADVTNHRNGVYYEAGFADGLGVPVIWTCAEADAENTHFDTKHLNQIRWKSHEDLRQRLKIRILATIGSGPLSPRKN